MSNFFQTYLNFWFISIPLTFVLAYKIGTEILDLFLNADKINELNKYSDSLNYEALLKEHQINKSKGLEIRSFNLSQLEEKVHLCVIPTYLFQKGKRLLNIFKV